MSSQVQGIRYTAQSELQVSPENRSLLKCLTLGERLQSQETPASARNWACRSIGS